MTFIRNEWMNIGFDTADPDAMLPDQPSGRLITIADVQLSLDVAHVLEGQGIPSSQASPPLVATAEEVLGEVQALLAPRTLYTILPVRDFGHQRVVLDSGATFSGPLVARALAGAAEVAVAVCSIGPALDERVSALFAAGDPIRAMALDGAGTAAVTQLTAMIGVRICDAATARGWSVGMRASPGQEGWPIQQQRVLFSLVPGERIGVQLTSSCLMLPQKSVSFVIGLGPDLRADSVPCDFCSKRERCQWRAQKPDTN
jgi:exosome complex RNA-binding protein Csl4